MKKIIIVFFISLAICSNFGNSKVSTEQVQNCSVKDFLGEWTFKEYLEGDVYAIFNINIMNDSNNDIIGNYCSISRYGSIIDCSTEKDDNNITGLFINDTIYINFNSFYDQHGYGKAKIYKKKNDNDILIWELGECSGNIYLPLSAILHKKSKEE